MRTFKLYLTLILFFLVTSLDAQYSDNGIGISIGVNYTTTARMFLSPKSPDPIIRDQNSEMEDLLSYYSEFRYKILESLILGLNIEFIRKTIPGNNLDIITPSGVRRPDMEDGFWVIPIELSTYYLMPFSTEFFKFYMGGGIGIYYANHIRRMGELKLSTENRDFAYGIQVGVGMDYLITEYFSIRGELKFRDPEFELTSKYVNTELELNGENVIIPRETFDSKFNIDGITFSIAVVFHL